MRTKEELDRLRERAIVLRREGKSRREIQMILGVAGRSTLNELLRGVPPPDWTRRPNAKDDLRDIHKRHNPKTTRKNVGEDYHGCLRIAVHQSNALLRKIEGWARAIMADSTGNEGQSSNPPS